MAMLAGGMDRLPAAVDRRHVTRNKLLSNEPLGHCKVPSFTRRVNGLTAHGAGVDRCARVPQHSGHVQMSVQTCEIQGRSSQPVVHVRWRAHLRPADEVLHDGHVTVLRRQMEWACAAVVGGCHHRGIGLDEPPHHWKVPVGSGEMNRLPAIGIKILQR